MRHITEIHEEVYSLLTNINIDSDAGLRFSLRRTNRESRLDDGYWFYGNQNYLAVSFWSGNDWKNRTPNIIFTIDPKGRTFLELNTSDSKIKKMFVEKFIIPAIKDFKPSGNRYYKEYEGTNYLESLREFLVNDKRTIDEIIESNQSFFEDAPGDERIAFIDPSDFDKCRNKVDQYRENRRQDSFHEANKAIRSIRIRGYGPVKDDGIFDIPENTQWIFLTGENGTGKTNLLRGLAIALANHKLSKKELAENSNFEIDGELYSNKGSLKRFSRKGNSDVDSKNLRVSGFAAYGASRLITNHSGLSATELSKYTKKGALLYNILNSDGILSDLLSKRDKWYVSPSNRNLISDRLNNIREVLYEIIPNLHKVDFEEFNDFPITKYTEENSKGEPYPNSVTFDKLASGIKSMVAMFGDMMSRLFDQQPEKSDPAELTGIILIDEIDIHLHPKLQKKMVEELTKTFRGIQFIVTTHSPIPLLGAPINSKFFRITRDIENGVQAKDLSDIDVYHLLPNSILTSDLFEMGSLYDRDTKTDKPIRTENDYKEIELNDQVKENLKKIAEQLKGNDAESK